MVALTCYLHDIWWYVRSRCHLRGMKANVGLCGKMVRGTWHKAYSCCPSSDAALGLLLFLCWLCCAGSRYAEGADLPAGHGRTWSQFGTGIRSVLKKGKSAGRSAGVCRVKAALSFWNDTASG